jgi:beta-lactamase class A
VTLSDNTAGNLLLDNFGGPAALTAYMHYDVTRRENEAKPGNPRDTTTPVTMLESLHKTILGTALSVSSRNQLAAWLLANKTGGKRLRAARRTASSVGIFE